MINVNLYFNIAYEYLKSCYIYYFYTQIDQHSKFSELEYYHNDNKYIIRFPKQRYINKIDHIIGINKNGLNNDITDELKLYAGPYFNFHGISTTPEYLDYEQINIIYLDGCKKTFIKDDIIKL